MPQLSLAGRRWRIATDTLPLLAAFLMLVHLALLVPLITVYVVTFNSRYDCNKKAWVRAATLGILYTYGTSVLVEAALIAVGLRGGPLEERKRRWMRPLLWLEIFLWVSALSFTVFGTVTVTSPDVQQSCWSNNPCADVTDVIPSVCLPNGYGSYTLSPPCAMINANGTEFEPCFNKWMNYGAGYLMSHYNASQQPYPFDPPREPPGTLCPKPVNWESKQFGKFVKGLDLLSVNGTNVSGINTDLPEFKLNNVTALIESFLLDALGVPYNDTDVAATAPWWHCLGEGSQCQALLAAGDVCKEWDLLLSQSDSLNRKHAFQGAVFGSWAVLVLTAAVVWGAFNAVPDYESSDSWEGTVKTLGRLACCAGELSAETEDGQAASKEIGNLLHLLFGAVDLDPTDQLLGMYLVSERQHTRREQHCLKVLAAAGVTPPPPARRGKFAAALKRMAKSLSRVRRTALPVAMAGSSSVKLTNTLEAPTQLVGADDPGDNGDTAAGVVKAQQVVEVTNGVVVEGGNGVVDPGSDAPAPMPPPRSAPLSISAGPPAATYPAATTPGARLQSPFSSPQQPFYRASPFDSGSILGAGSLGSSGGVNGSASGGVNGSTSGGVKGVGSSGPASPAAPPQPPRFGHWRLTPDDDYTPPDYAHSFVRLVSVRPPRPAPSKRGSVTLSDVSESAPNVELSKPSQALSQPQPGLQLEVVARPQPLLTPVSLRRFNLPISAREAARIYMRGDGRAVAKADLQEASDMSRFALAAYGLQKVFWRGGAAVTEHGKGCGAGIDRTLNYLSCVKLPIGIHSRFLKRNMAAILEITGVTPADLLYVSYANATFGILPYMLLLHRPSRSVVLAVRGTASTTDLITDLLSNPVDATKRNGLPRWVQEAVPAEELYAHSGILSSTAAVLKDLEEHGLLQQMAEARLSGGSGSSEGMAPPAQHSGMRRAPTHKEADEARHLQRLATMAPDDELDLPLDRAQSVLYDKVAGEGWRVVVTGHSLGAAVACMLSFHLHPRFPDLQCFAFCPPGGLLSARLSELARPFCTSVAVGCDAISRLSFPNTQRVVDDMVAALARCRRAKLKLGADILLGRREDALKAPPTFCSFEDIGPEALAVLEHYCATSKLHAATADLRELLPPGRIMHLRPYDREAPPGMKASKAKALPEVWDAAWISPRDLIGEGILLSKAMTRHHRMGTLQEALRSAIAGEADAGSKQAGDAAA